MHKYKEHIKGEYREYLDRLHNRTSNIARMAFFRQIFLVLEACLPENIRIEILKKSRRSADETYTHGSLALLLFG